MPVIQQENGIKTVKGLPLRWGQRAVRQLAALLPTEPGQPVSQQYKDLSALLDLVIEAPLPIDATDAQLCVLAQQYANECVSFSAFIHDAHELRLQMEKVCRIRGVKAPVSEEYSQVFSRCGDPAWWRRQLRKIHGRSAEHAAIRLGFVSSQAGKYCSEEAALRRVAQNRRNANALKSTKMLNVETGQEFNLFDLADKGTSNKKIRRGEVMMRMAGCDQIAQSLGHVGLFVTKTAPSKYHAVLEKSGQPNPKYNGASPLDAHAYLNHVWQLTRAKNGREGLTPYGFRIAEPHHDACTHWHMLFFMPAEQVEAFKANLTQYAIAEDFEELEGDITPRIKFVQIDPAEGSAAAYMMKYVGKNIGDNEIREDKNGKPIITKEMRVDAWAGVWGIRQFQPIGQPPVTVWREMRRIEAKQIKGRDVPEHIQLAHAACQRIESKTEKDLLGKPVVIHAANWAEYIEAQGGVKVGEVKHKRRDYSGARVIPYAAKSGPKKGKFYFRGIKTKTTKQRVLSGGKVGDYMIGLAAPVVVNEGRYGMVDAPKPVGIFCNSAKAKIYKSTRYTWKKSGFAVAVAFPWSPVNNCTQVEQFGPFHREIYQPFDDSEWFETSEAEKVVWWDVDIGAEKARFEKAADEKKENTVWTRSRTSDLLNKRANHV